MFTYSRNKVCLSPYNPYSTNIYLYIILFKWVGCPSTTKHHVKTGDLHPKSRDPAGSQQRSFQPVPWRKSVTWAS